MEEIDLGMAMTGRIGEDVVSSALDGVVWEKRRDPRQWKVTMAEGIEGFRF